MTESGLAPEGTPPARDELRRRGHLHCRERRRVLRQRGHAHCRVLRQRWQRLPRGHLGPVWNLRSARSATSTGSPLGNTLLATSVVGSYSEPEWLERLKTYFYQRRISGQYLDDIHEVAIKAALKDQEIAGVDVLSDGELRRDNDIPMCIFP